MGCFRSSPGCTRTPAVCRAGDWYVIVNSEYLHGLPIHSSADLVTWSPVGNAMARPSQIAEHAGVARAISDSIQLQTLRHETTVLHV